jgi:hypothetical protein
MIAPALWLGRYVRGCVFGTAVVALCGIVVLAWWPFTYAIDAMRWCERVVVNVATYGDRTFYELTEIWSPYPDFHWNAAFEQAFRDYDDALNSRPSPIRARELLEIEYAAYLARCAAEDGEES